MVAEMADPTPSGLHARLTVATAVVCFAAPIALDLASGLRRAFGYLAADSAYYVVLARNYVDFGFFTFDQERATNGFHPLWQWLLVALVAACNALGVPSTWLPILLVLMSAALLVAAIRWLGRAMTHEDGYLSPLFPLIVPGLIGIVTAPLFRSSHDIAQFHFRTPGAERTVHSTLWHYANGMETPAVLCCFAACALFWVRRGPPVDFRQTITLAALTLALTLSRLDHVFFAGMLLAGLAWRGWSTGEKAHFRRCLAAGGVFITGLGLYLLGNFLAYGTAMPISGKLKSSFPTVSASSWDALVSILAEPGRYTLAAVTREAQMLLPALAALLCLPYLLRRSKVPGRLFEIRPDRDRFECLLLALVPAVLCLSAYNFLFVKLTAQGHWYFPVSTLFASLLVVTAVGRRPLARKLAASRTALSLWLVLCMLISGAMFWSGQRHVHYQRPLANFYFDEARQIRAFYGEIRPKILEFDDAIVQMATGYPTQSITGLVLDIEAVPAFTAGRFLDLAYDRGFTRIATVFYHDMRGLAPTPSRQEILQQLKSIRLDAKKLQAYDIELEYRSADQSFAIFKLLRRPSAP